MEFNTGSSKSAKEPPRLGIAIEDPVSSCDEFPRPLGPMLKYIAKKTPKYQPNRRKTIVKTNQAKKSKLHLSKAPTQGRKRPAAKVAKKRALTNRKPRKPKATGIFGVNRTGGEVQTGESNDRPWWKFLFGKKQDDEKIFREVEKDNISCDMMMSDRSTQTNASIRNTYNMHYKYN
ncbi:uncharacterized protein LOC6526859 [Drosophila yakuba]|uniref:Uncharacterized protein n=1 Tax=Drosophila yakuba TaxID=7245 RepID=B4NZ07_DROYA|nr:uncharacterized protein LOC6526859 [Drosophila yakuba]EDW87671.1 uncharacterized protein Dyak_GE18305 [Drosophila yakuba]